MTGTRLLFGSRGIELADLLSLLHIEKAIGSLEDMAYQPNKEMNSSRIIEVEGSDGYARSLIGLALKVKTRKY